MTLNQSQSQNHPALNQSRSKGKDRLKNKKELKKADLRKKRNLVQKLEFLLKKQQIKIETIEKTLILKRMKVKRKKERQALQEVVNQLNLLSKGRKK